LLDRDRERGELDQLIAEIRDLASAVGRLPSLRSGVNRQARGLDDAVAVQGS
jgi:hypothetical protein